MAFSFSFPPSLPPFFHCYGKCILTNRMILSLLSSLFSLFIVLSSSMTFDAHTHTHGQTSRSSSLFSKQLSNSIDLFFEILCVKSTGLIRLLFPFNVMSENFPLGCQRRKRTDDDDDDNESREKNWRRKRKQQENPIKNRSYWSLSAAQRIRKDKSSFCFALTRHRRRHRSTNSQSRIMLMNEQFYRRKSCVYRPMKRSTRACCSFSPSFAAFAVDDDDDDDEADECFSHSLRFSCSFIEFLVIVPWFCFRGWPVSSIGTTVEPTSRKFVLNPLRIIKH